MNSGVANIEGVTNIEGVGDGLISMTGQFK